MLKKFSWVVGLLVLGLLFYAQVHAQSAAIAFLSAPETDKFPLISAYLDIRDSQGGFISGLQTEDLTIIEDDVQLPASDLLEVDTGMQFVLAVNTATSFAIIDQQGVKRYDYIAEYLESWAERVSDTSGDDLSLVAPSGVQNIRNSDYGEWLAYFQAFEPNFQTAVPSLEVLTRGIDLAAEPGFNPGVSRAVLWLTPTLNPSINADLLILEQRARQSGIRVFVWMIDSQTLFQSEQAITLRAFANQTGGSFFAFSGIEAIPDLEANLNATRQVYKLSYYSQVTVAGAHELSVAVQSGDVVVSASPITYNIELQPPIPTIISVPTQVSRVLLDQSQDVSELTPSEQTVEIAVIFPDNIPRELIRTSLLVDGEIVAENTSAPFELFTWDLRSYTKSQQYFLSVLVEDELGLIGSSPESPVQITVQGVPQGIGALFAKFGSLLVVTIVLVAAAVLLLVLLLAGRIRPKPLGERRRGKSAYDDPVTQPIIKEAQQIQEKPKRSNFLIELARRINPSQLARLPIRRTREPFAYLLPFNDSGEPLESETIALTAHVITIGSDAQQAFVPIDDPGIEPLHARLWRDEEGTFRLADENSVAGTWINYAPVSNSGSRVEHGDLIHIGRAGFRFTLSKPTKTPKPIVIREKSEQ